MLGSYHAMGCNPVSMVDPLGLLSAPSDNLPNNGIPNAGVFTIEGFTFSLGGVFFKSVAETLAKMEERATGAFLEHYIRQAVAVWKKVYGTQHLGVAGSSNSTTEKAKGTSQTIDGGGGQTNDGGQTVQELPEVTVTANKGKTWFGRAWRNVGGVVLDVVQTVLDVAGLVPGIGEAADLINAGIYTIRGDCSNAALSLAAAVPFAGWAATGTKITRRVVSGFQKHHVIPKAVYKEFGGALKEMGFARDAGRNLKKLPVPFHGNHPAYNHRVREGIQNLIENNRFDLPNMQNLQRELRYEINDIMKSGDWERMNDFYKSKGYIK